MDNALLHKTYSNRKSNLFGISISTLGRIQQNVNGWHDHPILAKSAGASISFANSIKWKNLNLFLYDFRLAKILAKLFGNIKYFHIVEIMNYEL